MILGSMYMENVWFCDERSKLGRNRELAHMPFRSFSIGFYRPLNDSVVKYAD